MWGGFLFLQLFDAYKYLNFMIKRTYQKRINVKQKISSESITYRLKIRVNNSSIKRNIRLYKLGKTERKLRPSYLSTTVNN